MINTLKFSIHSDHGSVSIPFIIRKGATNVSGIHINMMHGIKIVKDWVVKIVSNSGFLSVALTNR